MLRCIRYFSIVLIAMAFVSATQSSHAVDLTRTEIASGLLNPVFVTAPTGDLDRLFIVEQPGHIRILNLSDNSINATAFLDIQSRVDSSGNEQGLLGLAFHPDYDTNGYFYVYYIHDPGAASDETHVSRFRADGPTYSTATTADDTSEVEVLTFTQPQSNHNGGMIAFQPRDDSKAYLYIASGDGGGAGDDDDHGDIGNGQNLTTLLGKILRIDVDEGGEGSGTGGSNYDIPPGNPNLGGLSEIWAYGLRNPYRFGFDRLNGDLYIGDVGQNLWEEIDHQPGDSPGGENYGWRLKEGPDCFNPSSNCDPGGLTEPVYNYDHVTPLGIAVIGGYPYRGEAIPFIEGHYIFADVSGVAKTFLSNGTTATLNQDWAAELQTGNISSFGEDSAGELYYTIRGTKGVSNGLLYKIIPIDNGTIRVDFAATGLMKGNTANPFDSLDVAIRSVSTGGAIQIVGDSTVTSTNETVTLDRAATITALNGPVTIGISIPDDATRNTQGFQTRDD